MTARAWAPMIALIAMALIIAITCIIWTRQKNRQENVAAGRATRGDLNQKSEQALMRQLDRAHDLFAAVGKADDITYGSFICDRHRELIDAWQAEYIKLNNSIGWAKQ